MDRARWHNAVLLYAAIVVTGLQLECSDQFAACRLPKTFRPFKATGPIKIPTAHEKIDAFAYFFFWLSNPFGAKGDRMKVIGTIGEHGQAVIVGRGANFVLAAETCFRIRQCEYRSQDNRCCCRILSILRLVIKSHNSTPVLF